jgi:hypothetical protein
MSKNSKSPTDRLRNEARIDRAVRRSVGMKFAAPSLRSMLRACGVYANVIAAVVALGLPSAGGLRSAAGSAALAFESAVRSARESTSGLPDFLTNPADLTEVTEITGEISVPVENPREQRSVESVPDMSTPVSDEPVLEVPTPSDRDFEAVN